MEQAISPRALQQRDVMAWYLGLAAAVGALALALTSPRVAASVGVGALLQLTNFRALWNSCEKILLVGGSGAALAIATFSVRFLLLGAAVGLALWVGIDAAGLLVGLSLIIPAAVVAAWQARPPVLANVPALADDDPTWDLWNPWTAQEREPVDEEDEGAMAVFRLDSGADPRPDSRPAVDEERPVHTFQSDEEKS